jgi:hypothetical protein
MTTKEAEDKVAMTTPQWYPKTWTQITVIMEDIAIFTKLFPIKSAAMNLSSLAINLWILEACFTPLVTIWRRRILLIPIIEVSDKEKKNDINARVRNNNDIMIIVITGIIVLF